PEDDYTATSNTDCYDDPDNGSFVHPGTTLYYPTDRGDGSFDYNCDGSEQVRWNTMEEECTGFDFIVDTCGGSPGWSGGSPPICGESRTWNENCDRGGGFLGRGCEWKTTGSRTQECL
ncbi:MAG: hypothetical protein VYC71_07535, partial [Planctomycetota bacterium]|nr:hypothetical protein [Planctomycetota bacterium]